MKVEKMQNFRILTLKNLTRNPGLTGDHLTLDLQCLSMKNQN